MICSRRSCEKELKNSYFVIENSPNLFPIAQNYCPSCGRKIIEENPKLAYRIVKKT